MGAPLIIQSDLEAEELRRLARREREGRVAARLIALANVLDGMNREAAARAAGMDRQTLRDWVHRYNAEGLAGLRGRVGETGPKRRLGSVRGRGGKSGVGRGVGLGWPSDLAARVELRSSHP